MRRLGTLCLLFGLATPAFAVDEPPAADETSVPWYRWLFLGERAKPAPAPKPPRTTTPAAGPTARDRGPSAATGKDALAKQFAAEQTAYLDRTSAIDRIRKIAHDQNDEAMLQRANELQQQADEIFDQRTARLTAQGLGRDDRATLERGRDDRPATADRTAPRRRTNGGMDR